MAKSENNVKSYPDSIETRAALLEMSISHVNETLERIDKRLDRIDDKLDELKKDMKFDFRFLVGAICALAAVMAHGFHWF
jgi:chromosome segregation ATPase